MTIDGTTNRIACNAASRTAALDAITGDQLLLFQAVPGAIQCTVFLGPPSQATLWDIVTANPTAIVLTIRSGGPKGAVLITKTMDFKDVVGVTYDQWVANTGQQFTFELDSTDTTQVIPADGTLRLFFSIVISISLIPNSGDPAVPFVATWGYGTLMDVGAINAVGDPPTPPLHALALDANNVVQNPSGLPTSKSMLKFDDPTTFDMSAAGASVNVIAIQVLGGGTGNNKTLCALNIHTLINSTTTGTNSGTTAAILWSDTNQFDCALQRCIFGTVTADRATTLAQGVRLLMNQNGIGQFLTAIGFFADMLAGNDIVSTTGDLGNPTAFKATIRKSGLGTPAVTGTAKGFSAENWSGIPTLSYVFFADATTGSGTTAYFIYSLCPKPSLFSGPLVMDAVLRKKTYTVATLPVGVAGDEAMVTDSQTPTYYSTLTAGSSKVVPVFNDGSAWRYS